MVLSIPRPAPKATSPTQCLLLYILNIPVPAAMVYPAMPYHIETSLYSCHKNSAPMKATAVCPEGNELFADLSGLSTFAVYFMLFTDAAAKQCR